MNPNITKSDHPPPPDDTNHSPPSTAAPAWGTWEELLLAYAVNRHGTKNWDSISSELRKRSSDPIHITPHRCEQKYAELKRRFDKSDENDVGLDNGSETTTNDVVPWLDELRNVRVLELQRELRNYDLYIESLQTKLKRLKEEKREKTGGETTDKSDSRHENVEFRPPEPAVSGDEYSDRENQSVNGSNGNLETGNGNGNGNGGTPVGNGGEKAETGSEPGGGPDGEEPVKREPVGSKSEGKNSDVQSSVSKLTNERVTRGSSKLDEGEDEDECTDSVPVRSLPLVDFLHKVQKLGSALFERRLDRQEKLRYKNLIKQHIDYETLQARLKQGWYSDGNHKFFRDLLLLVNNTLVFFPKQSSESMAAVDLRQLVLNEMIMTSKKKQKSSSNIGPKHAANPPDSLLLKPKLAGPIVVCRKRSSIAAKAAGSSGKKEQTSNPNKLNEENPKRKGKSPDGLDTKPEKKKKLTEAEEKKQGAAKFLNRMKRSNEPLLNMSKSMSERSASGGGDGKKDKVGKKSSSGRQVKDQGSPAKRSVGRPPKRAAVSGKRNRESVDAETLGIKQTKKRSKR